QAGCATGREGDQIVIARLENTAQRLYLKTCTGARRILDGPPTDIDWRRRWVVKLNEIVMVRRTRVAAPAIDLADDDVIGNNWKDGKLNLGLGGGPRRLVYGDRKDLKTSGFIKGKGRSEGEVIPASIKRRVGKTADRRQIARYSYPRTTRILGTGNMNGQCGR